MRNKFDKQLNTLNHELIVMGALCEEAIAKAAKLLIDKDTSLKQNVKEAEEEIDRKERDIENLCMKLLLQQQPVARDLRLISSALKMISDLERIGDQALDIAEIAELATSCGVESETHIADMARSAIKMVTYSVESFVKKDVALAKDVILCDDKVDDLFDKVKEELTVAFCNNEEKAEALIDLLMIAKYFERIGDHAENVAEWVIYSVTGKHESVDLQ